MIVAGAVLSLYLILTSTFGTDELLERMNPVSFVSMTCVAFGLMSTIFGILIWGTVLAFSNDRWSSNIVSTPASGAKCDTALYMPVAATIVLFGHGAVSSTLYHLLTAWPMTTESRLMLCRCNVADELHRALHMPHIGWRSWNQRNNETEVRIRTCRFWWRVSPRPTIYVTVATGALPGSSDRRLRSCDGANVPEGCVCGSIRSWIHESERPGKLSNSPIRSIGEQSGSCTGGFTIGVTPSTVHEFTCSQTIENPCLSHTQKRG